MTCPTAARLADRLMPRMAFASRGFCPSSRHADTDGRVPDALPTQKDCFRQQLQAQRLVLLREAERQRNLRRSKAASLVEADLRDVTTMLLGMQ